MQSICIRIGLFSLTLHSLLWIYRILFVALNGVQHILTWRRTRTVSIKKVNIWPGELSTMSHSFELSFLSCLSFPLFYCYLYYVVQNNRKFHYTEQASSADGRSVFRNIWIFPHLSYFCTVGSSSSSSSSFLRSPLPILLRPCQSDLGTAGKHFMWSKPCHFCSLDNVTLYITGVDGNKTSNLYTFLQIASCMHIL